MLRLITSLTIISVTTACAPANIACNRSQLAFDPTIRHEDHCRLDRDNNRKNDHVDIVPTDNTSDSTDENNGYHSNDYNYDDNHSDENNDN